MAAEIVAQVVFMGIGEPEHKLDAIEVLGTSGYIDHKSIIFSTVGGL